MGPLKKQSGPADPKQVQQAILDWWTREQEELEKIADPVDVFDLIPVVSSHHAGVHNRFREFVQLRCRPLIEAMGTAGETACPTLLDQSFGEVGGAGGSPAGGS